MPKTQEKIEDYNVDVAMRVEALDEDAPDRLLEALEAVAVRAAVVHAGPDTIGAQFFVDAGLSLGEAIDHATGTFRIALEKAQIFGEFARFEIMSGEEFEREYFAQMPETYAGVTEVAKLLGVSRQRVSELRGSDILPAPVAELAAGPVWRVSSLQRFIETWERKPGRPRKSSRA
jgi:hypothetical protein